MQLICVFLMILGGIGMLIAGSRESALWGIGMLLFPIISLIFVVSHWEDAKKPFLAQIVGWGLLFLGMALSPHNT
jgi:hypothetical protein